MAEEVFLVLLELARPGQEVLDSRLGDTMVSLTVCDFLERLARCLGDLRHASRPVLEEGGERSCVAVAVAGMFGRIATGAGRFVEQVVRCRR